MAEAIQAADKFSELQQSSQALLAEFEAKRQRLCEHMASSGLAAVQLQRTENIAWLTAGRVDRRVLLPSAIGIATILVLRSGDVFYLAPDNEGRRLAEEDFPGLPFTAITAPWYAADFAAKIRSLAGDGPHRCRHHSKRCRTTARPTRIAHAYRSGTLPLAGPQHRAGRQQHAPVSPARQHRAHHGCTHRRRTSRARHRTLRTADGSG